MNRSLLAIAAMLLLSAPAAAQDLRSSATRFCNAVRQFNSRNVSAAPGSLAGNMIAAQSGQAPAQYRQLWLIAKALNIPACNAMW